MYTKEQIQNALRRLENYNNSTIKSLELNEENLFKFLYKEKLFTTALKEV